MTTNKIPNWSHINWVDRGTYDLFRTLHWGTLISSAILVLSVSPPDWPSWTMTHSFCSQPSTDKSCLFFVSNAAIPEALPVFWRLLDGIVCLLLKRVPFCQCCHLLRMLISFLYLRVVSGMVWGFFGVAFACLWRAVGSYYFLSH